MKWPSNVAGLSAAVALVGGGALLALIPELGWRKPTWLLMVALALLAIRPQLLRGGLPVGWQWGLHRTLPLMLERLAILALPFALTQVVLAPGSRGVPVPWCSC